MGSNWEQSGEIAHQALDPDKEMSVVLGQNVTRLRKKAKITKQKFALMIGVGRPFLNRIENGTANPRLSIIMRLAEALETTPQELLSSDDPTRESNAPMHHARLG